MPTELRKDIGFVTDSGADIPQEEADRKGIRIVPLKVTFRQNDGSEFDLTENDNLLSLMRKYPDHKKPRTSQPSSGQFIEAFTSFPEGTTVFCINIAKGKPEEGKMISGTYESAYTAATIVNSDPDKYQGRKVQVFNSGTVSSGTRAILMNVFDKVNSEDEKVRELMKNPENIYKELEDVKNRLTFYCYLRDLSYVADRMGHLKYLLGMMLNIVPILKVYDDEIDQQVKARGLQGAKNKLTELTKEGESEQIGIMHFAAPEEASEIKERLGEELEDDYHDEIPIFEAQSLIGSYVGPKGAVGAYSISRK